MVCCVAVVVVRVVVGVVMVQHRGGFQEAAKHLRNARRCQAL